MGFAMAAPTLTAAAGGTGPAAAAFLGLPVLSVLDFVVRTLGGVVRGLAGGCAVGGVSGMTPDGNGPLEDKVKVRFEVRWGGDKVLCNWAKVAEVESSTRVQSAAAPPSMWT